MPRILLLALALLCGQGVSAAVGMDTAARIYEAAAVRDQVRASLPAMPDRIRDMFVAESKDKLSDEQLKAIKDAAERGFRIDVFEPAALAAMAARLDEPAVGKVLKFLDSALGVRMVAADKALSSLDEPTIDKVMSGQIKPDSSATRDKLCEKLEVAARSTESTVQIFASMGRAVATGTAIGTGADLAAAEERSRLITEQTRKDMESNMRAPLRRYMAYGYRDLSNSDLRELLSFLESKAGVNYVDAYSAAMSAGFEAMGRRCGELLGGALRDLAQAQARNLLPDEPEQRPAAPR